MLDDIVMIVLFSISPEQRANAYRQISMYRESVSIYDMHWVQEWLIQVCRACYHHCPYRSNLMALNVQFVFQLNYEYIINCCIECNVRMHPFYSVKCIQWQYMLRHMEILYRKSAQWNEQRTHFYIWRHTPLNITHKWMEKKQEIMVNNSKKKQIKMRRN